MPIAHAMWVHGHSMTVEHPDRLASVWRAGFYVRINGRSAQNTWLHFAVPTPVIVDGNRLRGGAALVRFRTTPTDAWVAAVHVYDGERKIASHDGLHEAPSGWEMKRFDIVGNPEIRWGLGISINVAFHIDSAAADGKLAWRIDISSVGCDFLP
jgi:hypothetical protein